MLVGSEQRGRTIRTIYVGNGLCWKCICYLRLFGIVIDIDRLIAILNLCGHEKSFEEMRAVVVPDGLYVGGITITVVAIQERIFCQIAVGPFDAVGAAGIFQQCQYGHARVGAGVALLAIGDVEAAEQRVAQPIDILGIGTLHIFFFTIAVIAFAGGVAIGTRRHDLSHQSVGSNAANAN